MAATLEIFLRVKQPHDLVEMKKDFISALKKLMPDHDVDAMNIQLRKATLQESMRVDLSQQFEVDMAEKLNQAVIVPIE